MIVIWTDLPKAHLCYQGIVNLLLSTFVQSHINVAFPFHMNTPLPFVSPMLHVYVLSLRFCPFIQNGNFLIILFSSFLRLGFIEVGSSRQAKVYDFFCFCVLYEHRYWFYLFQMKNPAWKPTESGERFIATIREQGMTQFMCTLRNPSWHCGLWWIILSIVSCRRHVFVVSLLLCNEAHLD